MKIIQHYGKIYRILPRKYINALAYTKVTDPDLLMNFYIQVNKSKIFKFRIF